MRSGIEVDSKVMRIWFILFREDAYEKCEDGMRKICLAAEILKPSSIYVHTKVRIC